jgi:hypothetical protein
MNNKPISPPTLPNFRLTPIASWCRIICLGVGYGYYSIEAKK